MTSTLFVYGSNRCLDTTVWDSQDARESSLDEVAQMSRAAACLAIAVTVLSGTLSAADQWIEVKSAHFTVISNAGERPTRKLVWQLEQVSSAMTALWS
jgi:hypothetical protein